MIHRSASHPSRRSRSGVTLIEILFVLGIFGIFAVIASSIFSTTMKILHRANTDDASIRAMDSAMRRLRTDMWNATAVRSDAGGLAIDRPDGAVRWSFDEAKQLVRSTGEPATPSSQSWPVNKLRVTFDVKGPTVAIEVSDPSAQTVASERLVSQVMLLNGGGS